jgi:D-alanyl-D-alanine dipeptidase
LPEAELAPAAAGAAINKFLLVKSVGLSIKYADPPLPSVNVTKDVDIALESTEARASLDQGAKVYEKLLADALEKQAAQQAEQSSRMIEALFEMIRTQKDSNSIQERILQTSM